MKYLLHIIALCLFFVGCGHNAETDRQLKYAKEICVDQPSEALTILSDMDTADMTEPQKARRALLQAYISVTWLVPVNMPVQDEYRVITSFDADCTEYGVMALIVKSEIAKRQDSPVERIEFLKDAEFLATQLNDKTSLAFIYLYLSQVYINGFNGTVSKYYANKSRQLFDKLGHKKQSIDARMAIVNAMSITDPELMLDSLEAMHDDVFSFSSDNYKTFYQEQLARAMSENGRNVEAIKIWDNIYSAKPANSNTLAHWAQAYIAINELDSASSLIEKAIALPHNMTDEFLCRNVQYDIWEKSGRTSELPVIDSLRNVAANIDHTNRQLENSSLAITQKYESATQTAWTDQLSSKNKTRTVLFISFILLLIYAFSLLYYRKRTRLLQIEHENDMLKIQCIQNDLFERENKHDALTERISILFKSRFSVIDKLAASYFEYKETGQEQKKIFTEAKKLIGDFATAESLKQLEEALNATRDELMTHFDKDFPKISASQRRLALFIFCGLSLQSISVFSETDLRNIYVYKSRLKSTIAKSDVPRKEVYLAYFA